MTGEAQAPFEPELAGEPNLEQMAMEAHSRVGDLLKRVQTVGKEALVNGNSESDTLSVGGTYARIVREVQREGRPYEYFEVDRKDNDSFSLMKSIQVEDGFKRIRIGGSLTGKGLWGVVEHDQEGHPKALQAHHIKAALDHILDDMNLALETREQGRVSSIDMDVVEVLGLTVEVP